MAERESWYKATVQCAASERREVIETNGASIFLLVLIISLVVTIAIVARFGLTRILWAIANLIWFFILFVFVFLAVIVVIALLL